MGRALRSGKTIASLSPPKKRLGRDASSKGGAKGTTVKKTAAKPAAAPVAKKGAAKAAPAKRGGKASTTSTTPAAKTSKVSSGKKHQNKKESESEDEDMEELNDAMNDSESGSDDDDESSEEEKPKPTSTKQATPAKAKTSTKKAPPKKEPSSDEESEEEESGSESDDDMEKVMPTPLEKSKSPAKKGSSEEESDDDGSSEDGSDNEDEMEENDKGFTDENAKWLKPKATKSQMKLMSSDEEDADDDDFDTKNNSDEDEESDDEMEVERQSKLIDAEMLAEQEEAEVEMRRTIAQQTSVYHLPTAEEIAEDENRVVPPSELRARIEDVLEVLADFKTRREPGRSRSDYIERLAQDMAELFGYLQELVDYFLSMFGPNECLEFLEASDKPRPLVVRVNTLKARRKDLAAALMKRGVRLDPLAPWSKVGLKIYESTVPIGATPEYLAGHYMLQSAASMCPVMALGPQPGDRVLDMSAAPGGKTSYVSQLMKNKGVVIANDLKPERQKATVANLHRLGVRNVVTCVYDGRKIGNQLRNSFDRILLDAPCSGLGVISRDPSVKVQRTIPDVQRCAHLQKELLLAAIDALNAKSKKGGGCMVYSTCSVAVAENEEVVNYLLSKRDVKLVETGLDFGKSYLCCVLL